MTTNKVDFTASPPSAPQPAARPPRPQSSVRLIVLLGLLLLAIGAYAYDFMVARPGVEAADKKIQEFVDARNKMGVKEGALVTPDQLHKELGMQPTFVDKHADKQYEVEYYCWWGPVPFINTRRHFISVVYVGDEPRRFSSHHRELPPDEALPIADEPAVADNEPITNPQSSDAAKTQGTDKAAAETKQPAAAAKPPATEK